MKPITPAEVASKKLETIPDEVIGAFNELIARHYNHGESTFRHKELLALLQSKMGDEVSTQEMCNRGWLDVEPIFQNAGWDVEFDKPGYNDSYPTTWTFTAKKQTNGPIYRMPGMENVE